MKINYDLKLKEELEKIKGTKPTLLLHVCCGPCSGNVLKEISEFFDSLRNIDFEKIEDEKKDKNSRGH